MQKFRILCKIAITITETITMKVKITQESLNETVYLCFNCEKIGESKVKKKEKKKNGWSKKTTRNCFFQ